MRSINSESSSVQPLCVRCGSPLKLLREPGLCSDCRHAAQELRFTNLPIEVGGEFTWGTYDSASATKVDITYRREPMISPDEARTILSDVGLPLDADWTLLRMSGTWHGPEWRAYSLEFFGTPLGWFPDPFAGMPAHFDDPAGGQPRQLQVWMLRVRHEDSPVFLEQRWHVGRGLRVTIMGLEHQHRKKDVDQAWRGRRVISLELERRTKPLGSGQLMSTEQFRRQFWAAMDAVPRNEHPRKGKIATKLGLHRETLDRYLDVAEIDWEEAKLQRARRLGLLK